MSADQLALDCEPDWTDDDDEDEEVEEVEEVEPISTYGYDLCGQGLTTRQLHNIVDVPLTGRYL